MMTEKSGFNPETGDWNDSLTGDFLWSRNNFGEARPDVMSPFTYSITEKVWSEVSFLPGYRLSGNIAGRYYANASVSIAMLLAMGKTKESAIEQMGDLLGNVPDNLEIPTVPLSRSTMLLALPRMIKMGLKEQKGGKKAPEFLETNRLNCLELRQQCRRAKSGKALVDLWNGEIRSRLTDGMWLLGGATQPLEATMKFKKELIDLVGEADANALFSNLSVEGSQLASVGPVVGIASVAQGKMSRTEYLELFGHRGPHEAELSMPRPAENPDWFEIHLAEYEKNPVDVEALLAQRRSDFEAAWGRLKVRYPKNAQKLQRQIEKVGPAARLREAVRDEVTRFLWVERQWALCAGELTSLGDHIFLLTLDEVLDLLSGVDTATEFIPVRKKTYISYANLPAYPMIIRGHFDPFKWAADPNRRNDIYDATQAMPTSTAKILKGFPGAAGRVEGRVRLLDHPEQGDQFQPGEILVAVTTNVGWTPIFPRAAAVITDVGAPLSHAAIVARELGIPAVVGCGGATTYLRTGDRVRVDGGQGIIEILEDV
jgi:phosphohistidine swiveling domain-containing protein